MERLDLLHRFDEPMVIDQAAVTLCPEGASHFDGTLYVLITRVLIEAGELECCRDMFGIPPGGQGIRLEDAFG